MKFLRELLLSVIVMDIVLYLYIVAGAAVLCRICGALLHSDKPPTIHHSKIAHGADSISFWINCSGTHNS